MTHPGTIYTLTLNPALDRELLVEAIQPDSIMRAVQVRLDAGGKGFNVSRALYRVGVASVALGWVGGRTGEWLRDAMERAGIATRFIRVQEETRTNTSIVSRQGGYLKVNEPGPSVDQADVDHLLAEVDALSAPGDWWMLSGSLPPGAPTSLYADLIRLVQASGARAILDASGDALRLGCLAGPYLVKPNAAEAASLTGRPVESAAQALEAAAAIRQMGPQAVVLSLGKTGGLACSAGGAWLAQPPRVREANPIGAGDAMVAGIVHGLSRGESLPEALCRGIASGAAAASLPGTDFGAEIEVTRLRQAVTLEQILY